jgi:hypothetical protein
MIGVHPVDVPHLFNMYADGEAGWEPILFTNKFLKERHGLELVRYCLVSPSPSLEIFSDWQRDWLPDTVCLTVVQVLAGAHAVLTKDGAVIHDPHPQAPQSLEAGFYVGCYLPIIGGADEPYVFDSYIVQENKNGTTDWTVPTYISRVAPGEVPAPW